MSVLHTKNQGLRLQKLANLGGLIAIAGIENVDPATLLGALLEVAMRLPQLSSARLMRLHDSGMERLCERNAEKRAYKNSSAEQSTASTHLLKVTLTQAQVKTLLLQLTGKVPVLEKI